MRELLEGLVSKANQNPEHLNGLNAIFAFDITDKEDGGKWSVHFTNEGVSLAEGLSEEAKCTFKLNESNFEKLIEGTLNPTTAFMMGKVKVSGDLPSALKLQNVLNSYR